MMPGISHTPTTAAIKILSNQTIAPSFEFTTTLAHLYNFSSIIKKHRVMGRGADPCYGYDDRRNLPNRSLLLG